MFEKLSAEYVEKAIDCFKLKAVKAGDWLARKEDLCKDTIFFVAEGQYYISDTTKRARIYGINALEDATMKYKMDVKMKEAGKIAWATLD